MTRAQVPRFIEVLSLAKVAHDLGRAEYPDNRRVERAWQGALPKRKHGPRRLALRIIRKGLDGQVSAGGGLLSGPELRLLAAAYDQGLADEHAAREACAAQGGRP